MVQFMCIWEMTIEKSCVIEEEFGVSEAILEQSSKKVRVGKRKEEEAGRRQKAAQLCEDSSRKHILPSSEDPTNQVLPLSFFFFF